MHWSWKRPSIPEEYRPWLAENQWWINFLALALATYAFIAVFQKGNWAPWMGFSGKTTWDWLDLLGVPLTLAILGYILQQQERSRTETLSREQREIAANEAKEEILQTYFDRLTTLLVDKNILAIAVKVHPPEKKKGDDQPEITIAPEERELFYSAVDVIRAQTLSILRRFEGDSERKTSVIRFLIEAEVIGKAKLPLSEADLSDADLRWAKLQEADLGAAKLQRAKLQRADLINAILDGANLINANLYVAKLQGAFLIGANLSDANLSGANLSGANLSGANLSGANLSGANLSGAKLQEAKLKGADLIEAILSSANLQEAKLEGADLQEAKLQVANLINANFYGANLFLADLSGADLSGAILKGAYLQDIIWNDETQWPDPAEVAKAKNLPADLKKQLGIQDTPPAKE